jgi:hypothetical protein
LSRFAGSAIHGAVKSWIILAITCLVVLPVRAEEKFDYAATMALALERTHQSSPEKTVFILGPAQFEETYFEKGRELKKFIPYCKAFSITEVTSLEKLHNFYRPLDEQGNYQIMIYRAGDPVLRLQGHSSLLVSNQFPFKGGDLVIITPISDKK